MSRKNYLEVAIQRHNHLYWIENSPEISDDAYDRLIQELKSIDPEHPLVNKVNEPSISVPKKIKHDIPMLSLDKAYTSDELYEWCRKVARHDNEEFIIEPKLDGWSAKYINGKLITRGDGHYGDDISTKIPLITIVDPAFIGPLDEFNEDTIGEIVLTKSTFQELNSRYKTPRNALGAILSSDKLLYDKKCLQFITFETTKQNSAKFQLNQFNTIDWNNLLDNVKTIDIPTDGLVIKLKDEQYSKSLGYTSHHPRGHIALKPKNPNAMTKVTDIHFFVGKDNTITPVAITEPVEILGHTVQKASLHNYSELLKHDLHIGDSVLVERCGEIIPQIKQCIPGENRQEVTINECPACGDVVYEEGYFLYCNNLSCPGSFAKRLTDSCKRLGLENIGPATIDHLISIIGIEYLHEIFHLSKWDIQRIPGFKQKSVDNMYNELKRLISNPIEDWKILSALNIHGIGKTLSYKLLTKYTLWELMELSIDDIERIDDFGPERALLLYNGLIDNPDLEFFLTNCKIINSKQQTSQSKEKTICFTGKMPEKRSYYENIAKQKGYLPVDSVSKKLDLLVAADLNDNRGKLQKARKLGIKVISLDQFL